MTGYYVEGDSWLHRLRTSTALLSALAVITVLGVVPRWWLVAPVAVALVPLYWSAGLRLRHLWRGLRTILLLAAVLVAFQVWLQGPLRAFEIAGQLVVAVLVANLVMMTNRVTAMVRTISAVAVPLRRFGVRRERAELLLALTIGCIPRVAAAMSGAREAAVARGVRPRLVTVVPAALVTMVREADEIGDAMAARGL
ncbi:energy-coupling factor transporter transmembrane protein EcfT [Luteipulveratus sp. YIM 133132]|uniref:energy-coupling factor transporter transmembrane protein EcfT n=1 Tax=Luteipulveratus flavus TaxID=3031728 RepID=UPI0023AFF29D|nr:energy-coupling factor transporter transmembrane protein EcfT [Luteipulveratus sp. YIM 133132]MDE9367052.1 energy-coupling factor transporter transmembrane protein EcfT [Luteipulveratus sp. YIM 133132]